jgi:exopolysaccharide biosynthesis polyprenyl glycosylphosphotransferase
MNRANPEQLTTAYPHGVSHSLASELAPEAQERSAAFESHEIFAEQLFLRMVCLERKRAERSGRRLVLMLLDSPSLLRGSGQSSLNHILFSLSRSKRDTDIMGWYRENSTIGVLFTEIAAGETSIVDILESKIRAALAEILDAHQLNDLKLSFYVYPDDCIGQDPGRPAFSALHPDLVCENRSRRLVLAVKRGIDIIGSLMLLVLLSPLLILIASAVKLTSRGPVVFRQTRMGQFGKGFTFLKFRSMYTNTDESVHKEYVKQFIANQSHSEEKDKDAKVYKLKNDTRVTKVGAFLRRTSLDELPQLFNVLTGHMSLVGPRPPLPYEVGAYAMWHKTRLMNVKPGITGFWQVHGRSRVKFDDMVRMDLHYAKTWSLWIDIKILLQTPMAVFKGNGAY